MKLNKTILNLYGASQGNLLNDEFDVFCPEILGEEVLRDFKRRIVLAQMVSRSHERYTAKHGETISIAKPGSFNRKRRHNGEDFVSQDASADSIMITISHNSYVDFTIPENSMQMSMQDLYNVYFTPMVDALVEEVESVITGLILTRIKNSVGSIGNGVISKSNLIDAKTILDRNNVPQDMRLALLEPQSYNNLLKDDDITTLPKGSEPFGMESGRLGALYGMYCRQSNFLPSVSAVENTELSAMYSAAGESVIRVAGEKESDVSQYQWLKIGGRPYQATGASPASEVAADTSTVAAAGASIGDTEITVDEGISDYEAGEVIEDPDGNQYRITSVTTHTITVATPLVAELSNGDGDTLTRLAMTTITIDRALEATITKDTTVYLYDGSVTLADMSTSEADYSLNHSKVVNLSEAFVASENQGITIAGENYGVTNDPDDNTAIYLNRALQAAASSGDSIFKMPEGNVNAILDPRAIALQMVDIFVPRISGAEDTYVARDQGISLRIQINRNQSNSGFHVNISTLYGLQVMRPEAIVPILG